MTKSVHVEEDQHGSGAQVEYAHFLPQSGGGEMSSRLSWGGAGARPTARRVAGATIANSGKLAETARCVIFCGSLPDCGECKSILSFKLVRFPAYHNLGQSAQVEQDETCS